MIPAGYSYDPEISLHTSIIVWGEVAAMFVSQEKPKNLTVLFKSGHTTILCMEKKQIKDYQDLFLKHLSGGGQ